MDIKNFMEKIVRSTSITLPPIYGETFLKNFKGAINVEWSEKGDQYEAVFYRNNLEHLANFNKAGNLIDYRMILPVGLIPLAVKNYLESKGEIMSFILINKGNSLIYEAIVRDKDLNRFQIEMSDLGEEISSKQL